MPHAEMVRRPSAAPRIHRSVSLEHDHASGDATRPFILTACARRGIQRIADGITSPASPRAWTLTGPFGTGKSSFCLFLSQLLSPRSSTGARHARQILKEVDPTLAALLAGPIHARGFAPIIVTGAREPLAVALARGLATALEANAGNAAKRLAKELRETASDARRDPVKMLDRAVTHLIAEGESIGILIVIDELGKLLEYAAANPTRSDVYLLQRLAEHAARAETPTLLVGVLHQDFSGYAQELSETDRQEWEKVRGRFEDIVFEQSADDMLRLIAEANTTRRDHGVAIPAAFNTLCERAWAAKIVPPGLEPTQGLPLLAACYPLHPSVTMLLGPIFKRFGQNERSAFSFLSSGEPHALTEFVAKAKPGELYTLVHLYEYLVGVFGDSLLASKDAKRWAEAFNVEAQHPDLKREELNLLRTIALLGIVGRWNGIAPTPQVLQLALSTAMSQADVEGATRSLLAKSAIVYRRFNDTYNLWEGSDIDVEARIADARSRIAADASTVQLLRGHFTPRPLVARRHSFEKGTLRYFDIVFATPTTLDDTIATFDRDPDGTQPDGQIIVALPDARGGPVNPADASIQALTARRDVIVCIPGNAGEVESLARELSAVHWVCEATADLQNDATARRELAARNEDVRRRLEQAVSEILTPTRPTITTTTRWIRLGEEQKLTTSRALNELLSTLCDDLFAAAPVIQNEIINRRELSSSAAAAQGNLIDHMLRHGNTEGLGIEGNPPERSIYLSVLRSLKLHQEHHAQWAFASSEKSVRKDVQPVYKAIRSFFDAADAAPRGLDQLFTLLRRPPFGLRDGVIPIFLCAALLGNEADVAVYENGGFLPQLTDATFEKLVKDPARYSIRRWHVSGVRVTVFEQLAKMLGQSPITGQIEARDMLDVVKPLVRFARKLNDFARQTKTFAPVTIAVRDAIVNASEPDHLLFRDLPQACGIEPFTGSRKDRSYDINEFLRILQKALSELQRGYEVLVQTLTDEMAQTFDVSSADAKPRSRLAKRAVSVSAVALNPEIKVFTTRLADAAADDATWMEQVASFLANKHPTLWHDDDRGRFTVRLGQMADAFKALESLVLARKDLRAGSDETESIRISVVGTLSPQAEYVVHLNAQETEQVRDLESQLARVLKSHSGNGSRKLAIAALARVAQTLVGADPKRPAQQRGASS